MKNVTITLDDKTAAWARVHASERGISLSRFIGELLRKNMKEARTYQEAMRVFLSTPPVMFDRSSHPYPGREALHDRAGLR